MHEDYFAEQELQSKFALRSNPFVPLTCRGAAKDATTTPGVAGAAAGLAEGPGPTTPQAQRWQFFVNAKKEGLWLQ